mmetsp:Transcript_17764/g.42688  ORF Transcript_17764/g.42688 Transcript_17764/m.42688 type:complete len:102 (+) Transcript_17764:870-1175(+)
MAPHLTSQSIRQVQMISAICTRITLPPTQSPNTDTASYTGYATQIHYFCFWASHWIDQQSQTNTHTGAAHTYGHDKVDSSSKSRSYPIPSSIKIHRQAYSR